MINKKEEVRGSYKLIGREEWPNGAIYEGNYKNGTKNGEGKLIWLDGSSYEGEFKNNVIEGKGMEWE